MACGGTVEIPSAGASGNSTGGAGGNSGSGAGGAATTGGTGTEYPGGLVVITPDQANQIYNAACAGQKDTTGTCTLAIPIPPNGDAIDTTKISVIYHINGSTTDLALIGEADSSCPKGDGWYIGPQFNAPDAIVLCPNTCATIHYDNNPEVEVIVGCNPRCCAL
jgi:hypothetical protein